MGIAFCRVNQRGQPDYRPNRQRHHLLPMALFHRKQFRQLFTDNAPVGFEFNDFPTNGVLLPTTEAETLRLGLPLHRGPHPRYNALILVRAENIRAAYARSRRRLWDRLDCLSAAFASERRAAGSTGRARVSGKSSSARSHAIRARLRNN